MDGWMDGRWMDEEMVDGYLTCRLLLPKKNCLLPSPPTHTHQTRLFSQSSKLEDIITSISHSLRNVKINTHDEQQMFYP